MTAEIIDFQAVRQQRQAQKNPVRPSHRQDDHESRSAPKAPGSQSEDQALELCASPNQASRSERTVERSSEVRQQSEGVGSIIQGPRIVRSSPLFATSEFDKYPVETQKAMIDYMKSRHGDVELVRLGDS